MQGTQRSKQNATRSAVGSWTGDRFFWGWETCDPALRLNHPGEDSPLFFPNLVTAPFCWRASLCNTRARTVNLTHSILCDDEGVTQARGYLRHETDREFEWWHCTISCLEFSAGFNDASSRELGIEGSRSFLCLFIIFTAQKMPILFYLKYPYSWRRHKHSFRHLVPVPQDLSVCPWAFLFCSHIMDPPCRCEMTMGKNFYFIVANFSFVITSRKSDFVDLLCEDFVMMTPNHIHRSQLLSSWK